MKKITLLTFFFTLSLLVKGQSYIGYLTDNYSGVHGVISNPANITDSRYKLDINLVGLSAFATNDYYGIHVWDAIKDGYSFDLEAKTHSKDINSGGVNGDVLGPSFMFNLSNNSAIAVFTRARFFANAYDVNGNSIAAIDDDSTRDFAFNEGSINVLAHAWAEIGLTYARTLINNKKHFIKGGVNLKYLQGLGSAFGAGNNISIDYDADGTDLGGGETTGSISTSGTITYARFEDFDNNNYDYKTPKNANGIGVDLGFVYEWRPNQDDYDFNDTDPYQFKDKNKYKLKLGISVSDIGFINYKDGIKEGYAINNNNVSEQDLETAEDINDFLNSFYIKTIEGVGYKIDLPTALHVNVDWNFNSKIYLNLNTDFSLMSKERITANRIANVVSLTPRYESKWFSFYLPLSVIENNGFRMGAGFRAGPLYVGSGSLISSFASNDNRQADAYAGLKIPIYQSQPKDKDGDGIVDKLDDCPKEPGPVSNNGCPIEDQDEDGVLDDVDECPEIAGPEDNNGCPWGDKDGDDIIDKLDACPDEAGPIENKGCPYRDSDGDGVLDKDDDCIDQIGTVANNGCPEEVMEELQKTMDDFARVILFNPGRATLKAESADVLFEIIAVLNEYPNAKFTIEGHTDSIGSYELNQKLSEDRANAVKAFFVKNGIDPGRLIAIGYGEKRPIATNMYKAGRAQNRRVEINLIK